MQEWKIPMDLLCVYSSYFKSALQGEFTEAKTMRVELVDENPETFALVVEWLYTHKIEVSGRGVGKSIYCEEPNFGTLLDTWMLADYLQLPKLQNIIMRLMDERVTYYKELPVGDANRAYQRCVGSKLSTWILNTYVWVIPQRKELVDYFTEISDFELLKEILKELVPDVPKRTKFLLNDKYLVRE